MPTASRRKPPPRQPSLFDAPPVYDHHKAPQPTPNSTVAQTDIPRITGQYGPLLALLRAGPVTNADLATKVGLCYRNRIHELRKAGYEIETDKRKGGLTFYKLISEPGRG